MSFGWYLLPHPFPPTGPDEGRTGEWVSALRGSAEELRTQGRLLLRAFTQEAEWSGEAADTYRARLASTAFVLTGLAEGMDAVAKALADYLAAARVWDERLAAGQRLDQQGVDHDYRFQAAVMRACAAEEPPVRYDAYAAPLVWADHPGLAAIAGQPHAPEWMDAYDSPQKRTAVAHVDAAMRDLAEAGLVAAHVVQLVDEQMTTGAHGHYRDPVAGLRALGFAALKEGRHAFGGHVGPLRPGAPGEVDPAWEKALDDLLTANDLREGSQDLADGLAELRREEAALADVTAAGGGSLLGRELGILGFLSDWKSILDNDEHGWHKAATDAAAGLNMGAFVYEPSTEALDAAIAAMGGDWEVPYVDVVNGVIVVGTALYTIGDDVWHHQHPPHDELP